jgi:MFS family permease
LLVSICTVFFDVSSQAYVPTLVEPADLVEANAKSYLGDGIGRVVGPFLGGLLIQGIGAALSLFTDAVSYLVSIVCLLAIHDPERKRLEHKPTTIQPLMQSLLEELREGFGVVFQHPVLRVIVTVNTLQCLGGGMAEGVVLIFAYRNLALSPAEVGIAMAIGSVGFVIGALLAMPMTRRIGIGPMLLIFAILSSCAYLLVPLGLLVLPVVFVCLWRLCFALSIPMYDVNQLSLRQALTPDRLRGRMNATFRSLSWGALGIGPLIGGYLATIWGLVPTIVLGSVIGILASLLLLVPSIATLKGHPDSLTS